MAFLMRQFIIGMRKQHIPGTALQRRDFAFDLNGGTGFDDLVFRFFFFGRATIPPRKLAVDIAYFYGALMSIHTGTICLTKGRDTYRRWAP